MDSQYSDNGDAQWARMDAVSRSASVNTDSTTRMTSSSSSKDVYHVIDDDEDQRLLQKVLKEIEEEERRRSSPPLTQVSSCGRSSSGYSTQESTITNNTSSSSSSSSSSAYRRSKPPLYGENMLVQIYRNNMWNTGRIIHGGVRSDGTYDIELETTGKMCRFVLEGDIRPHVPFNEVDSDDERMTVKSSSNKRSSKSPTNEQNKRVRSSDDVLSLGAVSTSSDTKLLELIAKRDKMEVHWQYEGLLEEITRADDTKVGELLEQKERFNFNKKIRGSSAISSFDELYNLYTRQVFDMLGRCQQISFKVKKLCEEVNLKRPFPKISSSADSGSGGGDPMNTIPPSAAKADWEYIKMEAKRAANQVGGNKGVTPLTTNVKSMDSLMGMT
eukprot:gene41547-51462_t